MTGESAAQPRHGCLGGFLHVSGSLFSIFADLGGRCHFEILCFDSPCNLKVLANSMFVALFDQMLLATHRECAWDRMPVVVRRAKAEDWVAIEPRERRKRAMIFVLHSIRGLDLCSEHWHEMLQCQSVDSDMKEESCAAFANKPIAVVAIISLLAVGLEEIARKKQPDGN